MSANPRDIPTMRMVVGSTSERYTTSGDISFGLIRYNTTDNNVEAYAKDGWVNLQGGSGGGKWTLGANGSSDYTFEGTGLTGAVNDPTLYLVRGNKYTFVNGNGSGAHPFKIQTTNGVQYDTGVTNNLGGGGTTITFEVPQDAPNELEYVCTSHPAMSGKLIIVGSGGVGSDASLSSIVEYTDNSGITFLSDVSVNGVLNSTDGSFSGNLYSTSGIIGGAGGWILGANGSSNYTFTGSGLTGSESNPTLNLFRGNKYIFINNTGGHPFQICNSDTNSTAYGTGVTNNGGAGGSTITFEVPHDAPKTLKYICTAHSGAMYGDINIHGGGSAVDASFQSDVTIAGNLYVDGSFNFGEVIKNITTVNNELLISTQVDISNYGTGPALSVTQHGDGAADNLVLLHAGTDGSAVEVKGDGKSIFYKDVSINSQLSVSDASINNINAVDGTGVTIEHVVLNNQNITAHTISASNYAVGSTNFVSASRQGNFRDLELKSSNNVVTVLMYGDTGNIDTDGILSTDTINEKTAGTGVTIDSVLLKDNNVTAHTITASNYAVGGTNFVSASRQGNFRDLELKSSNNDVTVLMYGDTGNIDTTGIIKVDTIDDYTDGSGVTIDGSLIVLRDLSVNGQIFSSGGLVGGGGGSGTDASFNVIGDFLDGSGVTFLTDVSINGDFKNSGFADLSSKVFLNTVTTTFNTGTIVDLSDVVTAMSTKFTTDDASFYRIAPIDGSLVLIGDLSVNGNIFSSGGIVGGGGGGGSGTDASFNVIDEFMDGSGVTFLTDVSFQKDVEVEGKLVVKDDVSVNVHLSVLDASFQNDITVGGNLYVDGSFNFGEVIKNITTVNNEILISTQVDISNVGTGPALRVAQFGDTVGDKLAVFDATGPDGVALEIMHDGDSVFYKDVSFHKNVVVRDASFINDVDVDGTLLAKDDVSFNKHLSVLDASFQNDVDIYGKLVLSEDISINGNLIYGGFADLSNKVFLNTVTTTFNTGTIVDLSDVVTAMSTHFTTLDASFQNDVEIEKNLIVRGDISATNVVAGDISGVNNITFADGESMTTAPASLPFAFTRTEVVDDISIPFQTNTPLTDLALNITPTSTSQKVILHLTVLGDSNNDSWELTIRIKRTIGGVDTYLTPTPVGSRNPMNSTFSVAVGIDDYSGTIKQANMVLVDTNPNTTSQITYTPVIFAYSNNVFYQNRTKNDTNNVQHERSFSTFTAECKA